MGISKNIAGGEWFFTAFIFINRRPTLGTAA